MISREAVHLSEAQRYSPLAFNMQDYHNHGIDPRVLDIRNVPLLSDDIPLPSNELWFEKEQGNLDITNPGLATGAASAGQSGVVGNQGSLCASLDQTSSVELTFFKQFYRSCSYGSQGSGWSRNHLDCTR